MTRHYPDLEAEAARWQLKYGQQRARCVVFMGALATLARQGQEDFARRVLRRADEAAAAVRLSDFTRAHTNAGGEP